MDINAVKNIFFVGIGGIGMSALARHFNQMGVKVSGYDRAKNALVDQLKSEGMDIHHIDMVDLIPEGIDLVIYTPAIPTNHQQLSYFRNNGFTVMKRSEVLEILTKDKFTIAVSGSHGKTTISSMIAYILKDSGHDCTAFLGGIMTNYNTNYIKGSNDVVVVEADEFDRSFLRLNPDIAVITAIDTDHLDIYGSQEDLQDAFLEFVGKVKEGGKIVANEHVPILNKIETREVITYSMEEQGPAVENGSYVFDEPQEDEDEEKLTEFTLHMGGRHNVENAIAAAIVAREMDIEFDKIHQALSSFLGIKRRFEYIIRKENLVFIDDYAHHPKEVEALLGSARELYPDRKITVVFQPHLFSRTQDLYQGFAEALNQADQVYLLPIYPARELPIQGVTSELIAGEMNLNNIYLVNKSELIERLKEDELEVLLTVGAGDIDQLIEPIKEALL